MLANFLKSVIVLAVTLTFFGTPAMADNRGRDGHHLPKKRDHYCSKHHPKHIKRHHHGHRPAQRRHIVHTDSGPAAPPRHHGRPHRHQDSTLHPLAPRIVFIGPIPFPVPPAPNEVLDYLTGHR